MASNTIYNLTNKYRQEYGLNRLTSNPQLNESAKVKAKDMCEAEYFSHDRPDGESWATNIANHYSYSKAGENLAKGFSSNEAIMQGWKDSPEHNKNMLGEWEDIGTATYPCSGTTIAVQHFGVVQTDTMGNNTQVWITLLILLLTICIIFYKIYTIIKGETWQR